MDKKACAIVLLAGLGILGAAGTVFAQAQVPAPLPQFSINVGTSSEPANLSTSVKILLLVTVLALAPSIVVMMTCFTRIVVVLGFLRQAIGTHQVPTNQIVVGLGLFLTTFIMMPAFKQMYQDAYLPYTEEKIGYEEAATKAMDPLRTFMLRQTREKDLGLFVKVSGMKKPETAADLSSFVIIPAFILSELRTSSTPAFTKMFGVAWYCP